MKTTRIWYKAIVSKGVKVNRKASVSEQQTESFPFAMDFPEGTTWEQAHPAISKHKHKISAKAEKGKLLFLSKVPMKFIDPIRFEFMMAQVIGTEPEPKIEDKDETQPF